jgi:hypothetical protein
MIYIKSLAAGITAVVLATLLSSFLIGLYLAYKSKQNEAIGLDPISFAKTAIGLAHCRRDIYGWFRLGISPCGRVVELRSC